MTMFIRHLIAATVVALALGLGAPAVGQSEEPLDPKGPSFLDGTWTGTEFEPGADTSGSGYTDFAGVLERGTLAADDSRIAGTLTKVMNLRLFADRAGRGDVGVANGSVRIDNDQGAWVGTYTGLYGESDQEETYSMVGEGAYEGLSAVLRWSGEDGSIEGVIVPGELPAPTDPIGPSASSPSSPSP